MLSVTLVHPAKAVGFIEMPFDRDTDVVSSNIVLDRGPSPPTIRGDLGVGSPSLQQCRLSPNYFGTCLKFICTDITKTPNRRVSTNLENLEYSGISLNIENLGNSQGILCNLREKL